MGILSVSYLRGGQRNIWWFEAFCLPFSGTEGPPKGLRGSPTVLKGQTSVPWKVEIKYSTMGWFHYGNTERYSLERWTKEYLMIWGFLFAVLGNEGSPRVPNGSQWTNLCALRSRDKIFYYGMISLWEYWALLIWEVDKGIFDDLRYFFAVFRLWWGPVRAP